MPKVELLFNFMSTPNILHIRQLISQEKQADPDNLSLLAFSESKLGLLHRTIKLPKTNPKHALADFITSYIEHVPTFLEALIELLHEAELYEQGSAFLTIAEEFFITTEGSTPIEAGVAKLLDRAYLSHRIIEEISDQIHASSGIALSPMDMSISNIVVHALLGDEYANNLDLAVYFATESLFSREGLLSHPISSNYLQVNQDSNWKRVLEKWPCLAGDASISLDIDGA